MTKPEVEVELAESGTSVGPGVPAGDPARDPNGDSVLPLALFGLPFFVPEPDPDPDPGVEEEEPAATGGWGKGRKRSAALYIPRFLCFRVDLIFSIGGLGIAGVSGLDYPCFDIGEGKTGSEDVRSRLWVLDFGVRRMYVWRIRYSSGHQVKYNFEERGERFELSLRFRARWSRIGYHPFGEDKAATSRRHEIYEIRSNQVDRWRRITGNEQDRRSITSRYETITTTFLLKITDVQATSTHSTTSSHSPNSERPRASRRYGPIRSTSLLSFSPLSTTVRTHSPSLEKAVERVDGR